MSATRTSSPREARSREEAGVDDSPRAFLPTTDIFETEQALTM